LWRFNHRTGKALTLVLAKESGARAFAEPYLCIRALTMVPALLATIGFAVFRGTLDVVTPLKISLISNIVNIILDPILIFTFKGGVAGSFRLINSLYCNIHI
jgi:Na+-driven multidrug efflux pump